MIINRLTYLAFLITSLFIVYFYGGTIPYLLLELAIALPVLSFVYFLICVISVKIEKDETPVNCVKNNIFNINLRVFNRGILFIPRIVACFNYNQEALTGGSKYLIAYAGPRKKVGCGLTLQPIYAGNFQCKVDYVDIIDFLGIFRFRRKNLLNVRVDVNPVGYNFEAVFMPGEYGFNVRDSLTLETDALSTKDIRKYMDGDNYRDIHWKISAKKNELFVKTNEKVMDLYNLMVIDLYPYNINISMEAMRDRIIEYAVSLCDFYLRKGVCVRVMFYDGEHLCDYFILSQDDIDVFIVSLVKSAYKPVQDASFILRDLFSQQAVAPNLVLIAPELSRQLLDAINLAKMRKTNVFHYDISNPVDLDSVGKLEAKINAAG